MNEYKKRSVQQDKQQNFESAPAQSQSVNALPNSALNDVFAGKRRATNEMMGRRVDPAPSVMARMNQAFGMDFSNVQVYRSDAMSGSDMHGMAQGNKVVLSSDVDLNTQEGQAVLGHELSHIRAQSMGIGTGSGLLQNAGLEHQADSEGLLAARGMSISGESMGMTTAPGMAGFGGLTPLGSGLSANASAPMQAKKGDSPELQAAMAADMSMARPEEDAVHATGANYKQSTAHYKTLKNVMKRFPQVEANIRQYKVDNQDEKLTDAQKEKQTLIADYQKAESEMMRLKHDPAGMSKKDWAPHAPKDEIDDEILDILNNDYDPDEYMNYKKH